MKKTLLSLMVFVFATIAQAQVKSSGYRAFYDFSYGINFSCIEANGYGKYGGMAEFDKNLFLVSTTQGYQFNRHLFIGAGIGYEKYVSDEAYNYPIYGDIRWDILKTRCSPFCDLKIGSVLGNSGPLHEKCGVFLSPQFGLRIATSDDHGINIGCGFIVQTSEAGSDDSGAMLKGAFSHFAITLGYDF